MTMWKLVRRLVITTAAGVILVIGVILLVIPGPGILVIALGLLLLSVEYPWAGRFVAWAKEKVGRRRDREF